MTVLTGVTGFLGRELLRSLLDRYPEERIVVLARRHGDTSAEARVHALLDDMEAGGEGRKRVHVVDADLTATGRDLMADLGAHVEGRRCRIIHGAATVRLDQSLDEARAVNVGGTRRMLDVAGRVSRVADLERFAFVGTAFVAGRRRGLVREDDLTAGAGFHNTYEQSKFEAELLVRSYRERLPVAIFRPSIIAGRADTGATTSYKTIYWPIKVFRRGLVVCIPGDPGAVYDLVPVDVTAAALLHILDGDAPTGTCYHLTCGETITLDRAVRLAAEFFDVRRIPPYVSPRVFAVFVRPLLHLLLWGRWRRVLKTGRILVPYLTLQLEFDRRNTDAALEGSGVTFPPPEAYLATLFRHIEETGWGAG